MPLLTYNYTPYREVQQQYPDLKKIGNLLEMIEEREKGGSVQQQRTIPLSANDVAETRARLRIQGEQQDDTTLGVLHHPYAK